MTEIKNISVIYSLNIESALQDMKKIEKSQHRKWLFEQLVTSKPSIIEPITKTHFKFLVEEEEKKLVNSLLIVRKIRRLHILE